jgi:hypothetical protein
MRLAVAVLIAAWAFLWTRKAPKNTDLVLFGDQLGWNETRLFERVTDPS